MSTRVTGWKRSIKLKDLLSDDGSTENVRRVAAEMATRLKRLRDYDEDGIDDFSSTVEELADIATCKDSDYSLEFTPLMHFNACLEAIYDWADAERVWIS